MTFFRAIELLEIGIPIARKAWLLGDCLYALCDGIYARAEHNDGGTISAEDISARDWITCSREAKLVVCSDGKTTWMHYPWEVKKAIAEKVLEKP